MPDRHCLVCNGGLGPSRYAGLLQCVGCGFITADVYLSARELTNLYGSNYFHGEEYSDYLADQNTIKRNFRARLNVLLRYVKDPADKQLFEIGSAYGLFLNVARQYFQSVQGIDVSQPAVEYARSELKVNVSQGDFLDHSLDRPIDVACMWDTIEHLQSPHLYIEKLAGSMKAGSIIAITTGDISSHMARFRGQKWRQIHPPTHLHYFSRSTLERLLNRYGFVVRYCGFDGAYRSLDMIVAILLKVRRNRPDLYSALQKTGLLKGDVYLNLFDIVYMIGEKRAGLDLIAPTM
jgi:SAM-dependent methyltransferase